MPRKTRSPFKAVTGLGQLQKVYARSASGSWLLAILGVALAGAGLALAALTATAEQHGLVAPDQTVPMLILAAMLFLMGVVALAGTWFAWTATAALYEQGVALNTGHEVLQAAWTDITAVYVRVVRQPGLLVMKTTHLYTVETEGGDTLLFDDRVGDEVAKLGNVIQLAVANTHFARYWDTYMRGQQVKFGPLALDRQKLLVNDQELPWSVIRSVKIDRGSVWIEKTDQGWIRWTAVSVPDVPNLLIFQNLVGRLTRTV